MAVEIQGLEFQIQEDSAGAVAGLENLKTTLEQLKGATANAAGLGKIASALKNIGAASQQLGSITGFKTLEANATSLAAAMKPLENIGKSGFSSMINGLKNVNAATESLNNADLGTFATKIQQVTDAMKPLATEAANVYVALKWLPDMVNKVVNGTGKIPAVNGKAASSYTKLNGVLSNSTIRFAAVYMALKRLANILGGFITKSNAYQENLNLFTAAMGEYAESALKYGETVSELLGIDVSDWIRNQGVFNTLATGFGVTADRAAIMSKNLTQLGYDISSFFNISVEDSMQKLQSGVSGELEPLRRLGYDLSQAKLSAVALSLGIDQSVNSMTQAQKAELRYYAIMNQVTVAQGDLARTLEAPANQLRILQAQFSQCARAIGNIFIPMLNAILPVAIAVVKAIRAIADAIASLFGFALTDIDYSGIDSLASGAGVAADNLDDAAGAAKKLKSYTMGFDELNILDSSSSGGGAADAVGGGGGGFDFELPEYDFLGDAISSRIDEISAKLKPVVDWIKENIKEILIFVLAVGVGFAAWKIASGVMNFFSGLSTMVKNGTLSSVAGGLKTLATVALVAFGAVELLVNAFDAWNNGIDWGNLTGMLIGIAAIVGGLAISFGATGAAIGLLIGAVALLVVGIKDWITTGQLSTQTFVALEVAIIAVGVALAILVGWPALIVAAVAAAALAIYKYWDEIKAFFIQLWEDIKTIAGEIAEWFNVNVIIPVCEFFKQLWTDVSGFFTQLWEDIKIIWNTVATWFDTTVITPVKTGFNTALTAIKTFFSDAWTNIKGVWNTVKSWFDTTVITPVKTAFDTAIGAIKGFFSGLWEDVKGIWNGAGEWFQTNVVDAITRVFKGFVNGALGIFEGMLNGIIDAINWVLGVVNSVITFFGGSPVTLLQKVSIPRLEDGGFVDEGQLFIAREAGAEMVGGIGQRTAVANNDQIVEGISAGVSSANDNVVAAIYALLDAVESKDMTVNIGDEEVGRSYDRYSTKRGVRVSNGAFANAY